jgi:hypothetical protein
MTPAAPRLRSPGMCYTASVALAARYGLTDELSSRVAGIDDLTTAVASG